jgi:hypothetical protein
MKPVRWAVVLLALVSLASCYETPRPSCAFRCGPMSQCPTDYVCNPSDSICHLVDNEAEATCPPETTPDAREIDVPPPPDAGETPDA